MTRPLDPSLLDEISRASDEVWTRLRIRRGGAFHSFVPSDLHAAHDALLEQRRHAESCVELGSGAGAVTIVADLLGYDAVGIEIEPWLIESAEFLADRFGSEARFVEGSFLPRGFRADRWIDGEFHVTYDDADSAWDGLDVDFDDFDVIYAFPWPEEGELFDALVREHGRRDAVFLAYCAGDGVSARRVAALEE